MSDWLQSMLSASSCRSHCVFLVSGNVRDWYATKGSCTIVEAIQLALYNTASEKAKYATVYYSQATGFSYPEGPSGASKFAVACTGKVANVTATDIRGAFHHLNAVMSDTSADQDAFTIIIDYAHLSLDDRCPNNIIESVRQWAESKSFRYRQVPKTESLVHKANKVILIADDIDRVHNEIRNCPSIYHVEVPFPEKDKRTGRFNYQLERANTSYEINSDITAETFGRMSAGLTLADCSNIVWDAAINGSGSVTRKGIQQHKQRIIKDRYNDVLTPIDPTAGFETIGGHEEAKEYFLSLSNLVGSEWSKFMPSGALLTGPSGTGKTAIALAAAYELGFSFAKLDLDKTYTSLLGETERNLRRALDCVKAMPPIILFIDELDTKVRREADGDAGVTERLFGMLLEFIGDPANAELGIFLLAATNRPDRIDPAFIREGRIGDRIPILPPNSGIGRWKVAKAVALQLGITLDIEEEEGISICEDLPLYTGAELRSVIRYPAQRKARSGESLPNVVSPDDFREALNTIKPSTSSVMEWTQDAIQNCSNKSLIPKEWLDNQSMSSSLTGDIL